MANELQQRLFKFSVDVIREVRETNYWIRIINEIIDETKNWAVLGAESKELMNILGAIHSKTAKK